MNQLLDYNHSLDAEIEKISGTKCNDKKTILVLSGGGLKGIAQVGALAALKTLNKLNNINTIAGTSAGALVAVLFAIGYTPEEIYEFFMHMDFSKAKSINPTNMFMNYGLDNGVRMTIVIQKLFDGKNINPHVSFLELYKITGYNLIITGACVNDKTCYYFSHEKFPNMEVLTALRITISIPIIFDPCEYDGKLFVDGGCIDNYPIQLFKDKLNEVIGIYVNEKRSNDEIKNMEDYLKGLFSCFFEGMAHNSVKGFEKETIKLNLNATSSLSWEISKDNIRELYSSGYNIVKEYYG